MYVFSDLAINRMQTGGNFTGYFDVVLLTRAPSSIPSSAPPAIVDLLSGLGYQELVDTHYHPPGERPQVQVVQTGTEVVIGSDISLPDDVAATYIAAVAFVWHGTTVGGAGSTIGGVTNPWLFITDETFGQLVWPDAKLTTLQQQPDKLLFSWTLQGTNVQLYWPGLVRSPGDIPWEPPRTQHVFLYPQRINYVPNPSFEYVDLFGWRANGALTRVVGGVDHPSNNHGHVEGTRLESIPSLISSKFVCISAYVRAAGSTPATYVRLGTVNWDPTWNTTFDLLSDELPVVDEWTRLSHVTNMPGDSVGSGALVVSDGAFDIDLVMLEREADLNAYFDGDSETSVIGDFSWQGATHQSLSFWYNNRYLVGARLFGSYMDGLISKQGLVYDWVPAGTSIYTHWDVLSTNDTRQPMVDFSSRVIP